MNHVLAFKMHYFELTHAAITQVDITDGQDDKYNSNEDYYGETGNFDRLIRNTYHIICSARINPF